MTSEDHIWFHILCFHVYHARFMVSAHNFTKVLFLTYESADSKCPGASTLIVWTVTDDDVGGSHLLQHAILPHLSGTVHGFSTEFHKGFVPHVRRRPPIQTRLRARGGK